MLSFFKRKPKKKSTIHNPHDYTWYKHLKFHSCQLINSIDLSTILNLPTEFDLGPILGVEFGDDGRSIAVLLEKFCVVLLLKTDGTVVGGESVSRLEFTPNGVVLSKRGDEYIAMIRMLERGATITKIIYDCFNEKPNVCNVIDDKCKMVMHPRSWIRVALGFTYSCVYVADIEQRKASYIRVRGFQFFEFDEKTEYCEGNRMHDISLSLNDTVLTACPNTVSVWKVPFQKFIDEGNGKIVCKKRIPISGGVRSIDFYRGSDAVRRNWFVVLSNDKLLRVMDARSGECIMVFPAIFQNTASNCIFEEDFIVLGTDSKLTMIYTRPFKITSFEMKEPILSISIDRSLANSYELRHEKIVKIAVRYSDSCFIYVFRKLCEKNDLGYSELLSDVDIITRAFEVIPIGSFEYYVLLGEKGDADAQFKASAFLFQGKYVERDEKEGVRWLLKSAQNNHFEAQYDLGMYYLQIERNSEIGIKWLLKSAENEWANSQYEIGKVFIEGTHVTKDEVIGFEWFLKAANNGHQLAKQTVSDYYLTGKHVKQNIVEGLLWKEKSINTCITRFKNPSKSFGVPNIHCNDSPIIFSGEMCNVKVFEKVFRIGEDILKNCSYFSKLFEEIQSDTFSFSESTINDIETYGESITEQTFHNYFSFLQTNSVKEPPKARYYQDLISLFALAKYFSNTFLRAKILEISHPILRFYLLSLENEIRDEYYAIISCYIRTNRNELKDLNLPTYLSEHLFNSDLEAIAKQSILQAGYKYERYSWLNDFELSDNYYFQQFECMGDTNPKLSWFINLMNRTSHSVELMVKTQDNVYIEFVGADNSECVGYCIQHKGQVTLFPMVDFYEIRGLYQM